MRYKTIGACLVAVFAAGGCARLQSAAPANAPAAVLAAPSPVATAPAETAGQTATRPAPAQTASSAAAPSAPAPPASTAPGRGAPPPATRPAANASPAAASRPTSAATPPPAAPVARAASAPTPARPEAATPKSPAAETLDLGALEQRLRDTRCIGLFTKLSLKNQVDDLLEKVRGYYRAQGKPPPMPLRQHYDGLLLKVITLLQDGDPTLAAAVMSSREAIWGILADPDRLSKI
jgi:hypothetical protein